MTIIDYYHKIKSRVGREIIKRSKNPRPPSYPFVSGDTFRDFADHIHDETKKLNPGDVGAGEIVFVKSDMLVDFFENIHPKIQNAYKLLSHNSDENITEKYIKYIDDKIIHWFAQNLMIDHPKTTVLPIGLENLHYYKHGIPKVFKKIQQKKVVRINKILFGFNAKTNTKDRLPALELLRCSNHTKEIKKVLNHATYPRLLNRYNFVASPPGNGADCHRTWEALTIGVIPIIKKDLLYLNLTKHGLILPEITSVKNIPSLKKTPAKKLIYFDYWKNLINETS